MAIREFNVSDMDAVIDIWLRASVQSHSFMSKEYWSSKSEDMREKYIPFAETQVYEDNGIIKGFISLCDDTVAAIFVDPKFQGQGIGQQLINNAKKIRKKLNLTVYKSNQNSVDFYLNRGFEIVKEQICEHTGHCELMMEYRS